MGCAAIKTQKIHPDRILSPSDVTGMFADVTEPTRKGAAVPRRPEPKQKKAMANNLAADVKSKVREIIKNRDLEKMDDIMENFDGILLDENISDNKKPLSVLQYLCATNAASILWTLIENYNNVAMERSSEKKQESILELLNRQNEQGETAAMICVRNNSVETLAILLSSGIDVEMKNKKKQTAMDIAILLSASESKQLLENYLNDRASSNQ